MAVKSLLVHPGVTPEGAVRVLLLAVSARCRPQGEGERVGAGDKEGEGAAPSPSAMEVDEPTRDSDTDADQEESLASDKGRGTGTPAVEFEASVESWAFSPASAGTAAKAQGEEGKPKPGAPEAGEPVASREAGARGEWECVARRTVGGPWAVPAEAGGGEEAAGDPPSGPGSKKRSYREMQRRTGARGAQAEQGGGSGRGRGEAGEGEKGRWGGRGSSRAWRALAAAATAPLVLSSCSTLVALPSWNLPTSRADGLAPSGAPPRQPSSLRYSPSPVTLLSYPTLQALPLYLTAEASEPIQDSKRPEEEALTGDQRSEALKGDQRLEVPRMVTAEAVVAMCRDAAQGLAQPLCFSPNAVCIASFSWGRDGAHSRGAAPASLRVSLAPHAAPFVLDSWQRYLADRYCAALYCDVACGDAMSQARYCNWAPSQKVGGTASGLLFCLQPAKKM